MAKPQSLFITKNKKLYINLELVDSAEWDDAVLIVHTTTFAHRIEGEDAERFVEQFEQYHANLWTDREVTTYD